MGVVGKITSRVVIVGEETSRVGIVGEETYLEWVRKHLNSVCYPICWSIQWLALMRDTVGIVVWPVAKIGTGSTSKNWILCFWNSQLSGARFALT